MLKKLASNPNGAWNEHMAQKITKQLLEGVEYLHGKKLVHLHLTHENVLLEEEDGRVVLSGFTLSKREGEQEAVKGGNVNYQAPELLTQSGYGPETDMWSVGVFLFLLLTGRLAFFDNNRMKRNLKISKATYSIDEDLSHHAKQFVAALLVAERGGRLSASSALSHAWIQEKAPESPLAHVRALFASIE